MARAIRQGGGTPQLPFTSTGTLKADRPSESDRACPAMPLSISYPTLAKGAEGNHSALEQMWGECSGSPKSSRHDQMSVSILVWNATCAHEVSVTKQSLQTNAEPKMDIICRCSDGFANDVYPMCRLGVIPQSKARMTFTESYFENMKNVDKMSAMKMKSQGNVDERCQSFLIQTSGRRRGRESSPVRGR